MKRILPQHFYTSLGILVLVLSGVRVHNALAQPTYGTIEDVGAPIRLAYISAGNVGNGLNGDSLLYVTVRGKPAQFNVVDVETGHVINHFSIKGAFDSTDGAVTVVPDGTVYIGTRRDGHIYKYNPSSNRLSDLGQPIPGQSVVFRLVHDRTGNLYGSTYPGANIFKYDPNTKEVTDYGSVAEGERYARSIAYDPKTDKLFVGTGVSAKLIEWDLETGKKTDITGIIPSEGDASKIFDVKVINGHLFFNLNKGGGSYIINIADIGQSVAKRISFNSDPSSPIPNDSAKVLINLGDKLASFDLTTHETKTLTKSIGNILPGKFVKLNKKNPSSQGYTYVAPLYGEPKMLKYNMAAGNAEIVPLKLKGASTFLNSIHKGPRGKIYIGGYKNGLSIYDPFSENQTYYQGIGQIEGQAPIKGKMYFGNYTSARILEYDPTLSWKPAEINDKQNPKLLFNIGKGQDRPFTVLGVEESKKLFVGTVPTYGQFQGALSVYDFARQKFKVYTDIIDCQSIISLAHDGDMIFGGSSIYGGLGKPPVKNEAKLFIWDITEAKKIFQTVPVPGKGAITALLKGPNNNIWGLAGGTLFIFDPEAREITYTQKLSDVTGLQWRGGYLRTGSDGKIYSTIGGILFSIEPATKEVMKLLDAGILFLAQDNFGNLYFRDRAKTNLLKYTNPDLTLGGLDEYVEKAVQLRKITDRPFTNKLQAAISHIQKEVKNSGNFKLIKELKSLQSRIQKQTGGYICPKFAAHLNNKVSYLIDNYNK